MSIASIGAVVPPLKPTLQAHTTTKGGSSFTVTAEPGAVQQAAKGAAAASTGVSAMTMLALQEAGAPGQPAGRPGDRQARQRGRELLAALASLQRELLGADPASSLARLTDLLAAAPEPEDPQLGQILGAIRLRAGIEVIRLQRLGYGVPASPMG